MTGAEFKAIRTQLGLTGADFALVLGYGGSTQGLRTVTYMFESGRREIPETVARLAFMFAAHGIPDRIKFAQEHRALLDASEARETLALADIVASMIKEKRRAKNA